MFDPSRCAFTEGSVAIPQGYSDRTVNVLLSADSDAPSINISRDTQQSGESLADYITRQLDTLSSGLKGWALKSRQPVTLGREALAGEKIVASYLRDGRRIWQHQAVFTPGEGHILVFTLAHTQKLTERDEHLFQQILHSFEPV